MRFQTDFPLHPRSKIPFLNFWDRARVKESKSHERAPLPNRPTPATSQAKYVYVLGNYIHFSQGGWKEVTYIPFTSNNKGSGLWIELYEGW